MRAAARGTAGMGSPIDCLMLAAASLSCRMSGAQSEGASHRLICA